MPTLSFNRGKPSHIRFKAMIEAAGISFDESMISFEPGHRRGEDITLLTLSDTDVMLFTLVYNVEFTTRDVMLKILHELTFAELDLAIPIPHPSECATADYLNILIDLCEIISERNQS